MSISSAVAEVSRNEGPLSGRPAIVDQIHPPPKRLPAFPQFSFAWIRVNSSMVEFLPLSPCVSARQSLSFPQLPAIQKIIFKNPLPKAEI
jgi:hypothetical protein